MKKGTGARVSEVCQLRAEDVLQQENVCAFGLPSPKTAASDWMKVKAQVRALLPISNALAYFAARVKFRAGTHHIYK